MASRRWRVLERRCLLKAPPWLEVYRETLELPGGRVVDDYYTLRLPDYAAAVAVTRSGRVVMERVYKHGAGRVVYEVPAGHIERGETPLAAAKRELREETGYVSRNWQALGEFVTNGNRGGGKACLFLARDCERAAEPSGPDLEDPEVCLLSSGKVWALLDAGRVMTVGTAAALALARRRLQQAAAAAGT